MLRSNNVVLVYMSLNHRSTVRKPSVSIPKMGFLVLKYEGFPEISGLESLSPGLYPSYTPNQDSQAEPGDVSA